MEAHYGRSALKKHTRNIGRAYRSQAMDLISICLIFSQGALQSAHEDVELRSVLRACDLALHSAADSGQKVTDEANNLFETATRVLYRYFVRWHCRFLCLARAILLKGSHINVEDKWRPKMMITFVLLRSPLAALRDPETVIIRQILSAEPSLSEILWNFGRYKGRARITLEQNPHFYSSLPADESTFTPLFKRRPLGELSTALKPHDTVYVLVDGPGRMFFETEGEKRSFGNGWMLNGTLILKDRNGVLEGEKSIRTFSVGGSMRSCKRPVVIADSESLSRLDHSSLPPITTTLSTSLAFCRPSKEWIILSSPASCSSGIPIYGTQDAPWLSGSSKDLLGQFPLPPTSERPEYRPQYTSIDSLNDDILLSIFNYYRVDDEKHWHRLGWYKLAHVFRRWRHLIYGSASHLDVQLLCTNGSPGVDALAHLPPLPLVIDYQFATATVGALDELGISHALQLRDRVRHAVLRVPSSSLHKSLALMGEPFPNLRHLSLSSTADEDSSVILPDTFMAPNLRHLMLSSVGLPGVLTSLSTASLVTLTLANIRASGYLLPKHLVTLLQSSSQLEELSISFSIRLPRPSAEWELSHELRPPLTLPTLKRLVFRGGSAYLDSLVAQMRAPHLQLLDITLFNQLTSASPHLPHFTDAAQALKLPIAKIAFRRDMVNVSTGDDLVMVHGSRYCSVQVMCKPFDWQIGCAAQICGALVPALSNVGKLILDSDEERRSLWPNGAVDGVTWLELLKPFVGARELHVHSSVLAWELSRAFQLDDVLGLDPELLSALSWLVHETHIVHTFAPFNNTRHNAARRVPRLTPSPSTVHRASLSTVQPAPPSTVHFTPPSPVHLPLSPAHVGRKTREIGALFSSEMWWRDHYREIGTSGYRPRSWYDPHWEPSWRKSTRDFFMTEEVNQASSSKYSSELICSNPLSPKPVPYVPPVRVEQDSPPSRAPKNSVKTQAPPKHIRCRIRPSHKGAGSAWR